ncbi:hypothetical protein [Mesorhizobium sp. WSM2239]|uniref:Uncharacterized protein n=2 Tax=unclassified Mesorhizobium TaxID=325217 RepID=A0AAU8D6T5_9HYPH
MNTVRLAPGGQRGLQKRLLTAASVATMLEDLGHARDDETAGDLAGDLGQLAVSAGTVEMLTGALVAMERYGFGRVAGSWLTDALLAQRLGSEHVVPLLGTGTAQGQIALGRVVLKPAQRQA